MQKKYWYRLKIACVFVACACVCLLLYRYRIAIAWNMKNRAARGVCCNSVHVTSMPHGDIPDGWKRHTAICEFSLPPEFLLVGKGYAAGRVVTFRFQDTTVFVDDGVDDKEMASILDNEFMTTLEMGKTLPRLRAECFETDPGKFDWTLTPQETKSRYFYLSNCHLLRVLESDCVEFLSLPSLEGILIVDKSRSKAVFDWQSGGVRGFILFSVRENTLDLSWVRSVCWSVRLP